MHKYIRRILLLGAVAFLAAGVSVAAALPVETFFQSLKYSQIVISPSGRYIALLYPANGTTNAAVIDLVSKTNAVITGFSPPGSVKWISWLSDERLIYEVDLIDKRGNEAYNIAAVNRDGKNAVLLVDNMNLHLSRYYWDTVVAIPKDKAATVLMASDLEAEAFPSVYSVDTEAVWRPMASQGGRESLFPTRRTRVVTAPGRRCEYTADHTNTVRVCMTTEPSNAHKLIYRAANDSQWTTLEIHSAGSSLNRPLGFMPDNRRLYMLSNVDRDTQALFEYDPESRHRGRLLFEAPGVDLTDVVWARDGSRIVGAHYYTDRSHVQYFEDEAVITQGELEKAFPGMRVTITSSSLDGRQSIVLVDSDQTPGKFYLFDDTNKESKFIVDRAPWIDPNAMAAVKPINYRARDGLEINGYLTLPRGKDAKNLPLIVHPHGGPFGVRDYDGWDPEAQFLANRGYAVFQVNYRGSGGYGASFLAAGAREWGGKMQDDITDGVEWAVKAGIADSGRICIFGTSYGGYAALMGVIRTPGMYRCAVSYAGVTDLKSVFQSSIRISGMYKDRSLEELAFWDRVVGNRKDSAYLRERSPLHNVDKIRVPVFIAHGERDLVVPFSDATKLRDALLAAKKPMEFLSKRDEGHGFIQDGNQYDLYSQIETFLQKYNPAD